jgi:hypothetical protein
MGPAPETSPTRRESFPFNWHSQPSDGAARGAEFDLVRASELSRAPRALPPGNRSKWRGVSVKVAGTGDDEMVRCRHSGRRPTEGRGCGSLPQRASRAPLPDNWSKPAGCRPAASRVQKMVELAPASGSQRAAARQLVKASCRPVALKVHRSIYNIIYSFKVNMGFL